MWLFVVALYNKYELPVSQYLFQAFLGSIVNILESIAIIIGLGVATGLAMLIPPLGFFAGVSLFMFPHVWFARRGIERFERLFYMTGKREK